MRRYSRFERRLLGTMALVAFAPLLGALVLGRPALRDAYRLGVNPEIRARLEESAEASRAHLETLRDDAEHVADAIAFHRALDPEDPEAFFRASLARYPSIASIATVQGDDEIVLVEEPTRLDPDTRRPVTLERELGDGWRLRVVATAPVAVFESLQAAGEAAEVIARLDDQADYVSGTYVIVYIVFLAIIIIGALALALVLARRVTRRVGTLALAVRKVGAGDLTVYVQTEGRDEVGELIDTFNGMVRDLRESRARIDYLQRIGAWQEFARRLAHEIKNPLTPIQLAAQEIHQSYRGDDERYRRKLDDARAIIEEEVDTLRRLVGEFSAFAKLPEAELVAADLRDFLSDLARNVPAIREDVIGHGEGGPTVEITPPSEPTPVAIDAMMLRRGIDNLVRNALQALRGRDGGRVRVTTRDAGDQLELWIEDDGPGIRDADLERVFDPYFTTKSDGTGLGLAIVKKVVLEHGGEIRAQRSELGGAAFVLTLPRAD
ncbi:MAG: HAMP domain-containing protein [Myxococcales bacterium]|nr:HAMP domain-containing protein [Myxococcales bacterium]